MTDSLDPSARPSTDTTPETASTSGRPTDALGRQRARVRRQLIGLVVVASALLTPSPGVADPRSAIPADHPCHGAILSILRTWGAHANAARLADRSAGVRIVTVPTDRLGVWAVLRLASEATDGSGSAELFEPGRATRRTWDQRCEIQSATERPVRRPRAAGDTFTDEDLGRALRRLDTGVIFLWSPHMPLSVSGYRAIESATTRLGLPLVPLLDPRADRTYATVTAREAGMPPSTLVPMASVELTFRDLATHAPSIQLFASGRLIDAMLPGYRDPAYYADYITARLAARRD